MITDNYLIDPNSVVPGDTYAVQDHTRPERLYKLYTVIAVDTKNMGGETFYSISVIGVNCEFKVIRWIAGKLSWKKIAPASE